MLNREGTSGTFASEVDSGFDTAPSSGFGPVTPAMGVTPIFSGTPVKVASLDDGGEGFKHALVTLSLLTTNAAAGFGIYAISVDGVPIGEPWVAPNNGAAPRNVALVQRLDLSAFGPGSHIINAVVLAIGGAGDNETGFLGELTIMAGLFL